VEPPDGRIPPSTPDAQARFAAAVARRIQPAGPEDYIPSERCLHDDFMPALMPSAAGSLVGIIQAERATESGGR